MKQESKGEKIAANVLTGVLVGVVGVCFAAPFFVGVALFGDADEYYVGNVNREDQSRARATTQPTTRPYSPAKDNYQMGKSQTTRSAYNSGMRR